MTIQKIIRHGNALAVVIPAQFCRALKWKRGQHLELYIADDGAFKGEKHTYHLTIWKAQPKKSHSTK